jgi:glutaredoxin
MVIRVYISRTSGDIEVKQRQKRVLLILDSKNIQYEVVDIADDDNKAQKDFMQRNATRLAGTLVELNPVHPLPPQIFSDDEYCGVSLLQEHLYHYLICLSMNYSRFINTISGTIRLLF